MMTLFPTLFEYRVTHDQIHDPALDNRLCFLKSISTHSFVLNRNTAFRYGDNGALTIISRTLGDQRSIVEMTNLNFRNYEVDELIGNDELQSVVGDNMNEQISDEYFNVQ